MNPLRPIRSEESSLSPGILQLLTGGSGGSERTELACEFERALLSARIANKTSNIPQNDLGNY